MCLFPRLARNQKYMPNKKNGGLIPPVNDDRVLHVSIGCGECIECRKKKAREWQARLLNEIETNPDKALFITLTFNNDSLIKLSEDVKNWKLVNGKRTRVNQEFNEYELNNAIAIRATRLFLERWRKEHKKSVKHWFVTELGHKGTERIHLHGIIWTKNKQSIINNWHYGWVWTGKKQKITVGKNNIIEEINYVNERTVGYICKYVQKMDEKHPSYKSIILCSPGIGKKYADSQEAKLNKFNGKETKEYFRTKTGHKIGLPIYWRNKIYNEEEKEKLWLHKLDEKIRYIRGEKISIAKNFDDYFETLNFHREINNRLGYGNNCKGWDKEEYLKKLLKINASGGPSGGPRLSVDETSVPLD